MKRSPSIICISLLACSLLSCNSSSDQADEQEVLAEADTITTTAVAAEEEKDSLLHPVQQVILKAVGNTLEEVKYDQDTIIVETGALVKLILINEGTDQSVIHNVVLTEAGKYKLVALAGAKVGAPGNYIPDSAGVLAASPLALPGQTVEMEFTAPVEPGAYNFVCTYPGHWQNMNGILLVRE